MRLNEYEIDRALEVVGQYTPVFLPYVKFLSDWRDIVNQNSDGWAYWSAGTRPAAKLEDLVAQLMNNITGRGVAPSAREFERALIPIKRFATLKKLPAPVLGGEAEELTGRMSKDDAKFVLWIENTLVPDLKDSGTVETAADFERLIRIIRNLARV
jgi:hypothetical protein